MNIDPTLLRTFVTVTETGGFTRAAQQLNLTQSARSVGSRSRLDGSCCTALRGA